MKFARLLILLTLVSVLITGIVLPSLAASRTDVPQRTVAPQQKDAKKTAVVIRGLVSEKSGNVIKVGTREVTLDDKTKYRVAGVKNATLADIKVGMQVIIRAVEENQKVLGRQVAVAPSRHAGKITAYSYNPPNGGSITIEQKSGQTVTFQIAGDKFTIRPPGTTPKVGDLAMVVSFSDPSGSGLVATGVLIRRPPLKVSGAITGIDESAKTITIGTTVVKYDSKTLFALRGQIGVKVGQQATVFYRQQADGSFLATRVQIS